MIQRVVFLCSGNTCRSPLAEVIAADMFNQHGLIFASAGLQAVAGLPAAPSSVAYATARGLTLTGHHSQPVTPDLLDDTAWFVGMTRSHAAIFGSRFGAAFSGAIGILGAPGLDLTKQTNSPVAEEVSDPYGLSRERYFRCGEQITRLLAGWAETFSALATDRDSVS